MYRKVAAEMVSDAFEDEPNSASKKCIAKLIGLLEFAKRSSIPIGFDSTERNDQEKRVSKSTQHLQN